MLLARYSVDRWNYSWVVWKENTTLCVEKKKAQHTKIKTSSQLKYVGGSIIVCGCFPASASCPGQSSPEKLIPKFIKTFCRRMLECFAWDLSANWCSTEVDWWNRTTTQNTEVNQQQNGFNRRKYAFWRGPESWPQPDWDGVAWPQESNSHQTAQVYCWTETVL